MTHYFRHFQELCHNLGSHGAIQIVGVQGLHYNRSKHNLAIQMFPYMQMKHSLQDKAKLGLQKIRHIFTTEICDSY